jgi:hypothetical protein
VENENVRCADCGFLSGKRAEDPEFYAVSLQWRQTGIPDGPKGLSYAPHCFKGVSAPGTEYQSQTGPEDRKQTAFLAVINTERTCPEFFRHEPGRTPKEHADLKREELLQLEYRRQRESDRAWQDERRARDMAEAAAQRERDQERAERIRKQDQEEAERVRREDREWKAEQDKRQFRRHILTALVIAVIGTILAILAEPWKQKDRQPTLPREPQPSPVANPK